MLLNCQTFLQPKDSFKVFARIRPYTQNQQKLQASRQFFSHDHTTISLKTKHFQQTFNFDHIFSSKSQQHQIFDLLSKDILDNAFKGNLLQLLILGINGTIFCYGQTSSGKTHTIVGDYGSHVLEKEGLLPRILKEVIKRKDQMIDDAKSSQLDIRIKISIIEIYNQKIFDLFDISRKDLRLRQNKKQGVFVENITQNYITSVDQAMKFVFSGLENRTQGKTNQNTFSSRSHMIFAISLVETDFERKEAKSAKITLIDLAGSQRLAKTGVQGKMLLETKKINLSLSTLSKVINALSQGNKKHIPYRDSKLTRLLKESIGGNCLTHLIINLSPSSLNESETVSALRFGSKAKLIQNKPRINKEYTVEELLVLLERAQIKIKQLTKFIQEFEKTRTSQSALPKCFIGMRQKATEHISLHLVDYNDGESDERISFEGSSKISSVHETSQNLNKDGFGVFSPFGIDVDIDSPEGKKQYRKSVITSSKSMKLLPFVESPQMKKFNQNDEIRQKIQNSMRVSAFVENQEDQNPNINSYKHLKRKESLDVEDLNNILGDELMLRKNNSFSMEQKLDFSVKSIHESVNEIRQRCLERLGIDRKSKNSMVSCQQNQKSGKMGGLSGQEDECKQKKLQIISCYSLNLEGKIKAKIDETKRTKVQENNLKQIKEKGGSHTNLSQQKLKETQQILQQKQFESNGNQQSLNDKTKDITKIQSLQSFQQLTQIKSLYEENLKQLETHKYLFDKLIKIIKEQNVHIAQMRHKQIARRNNLSQDIDKLKLFMAQKSPRSSILPLQILRTSHISFDKL